jgi:segregation and condensation protein B
MSDDAHANADLKQVVNALIFAAKQPLSLAALHQLIAEVAATRGASQDSFVQPTLGELQRLVGELRADWENRRLGLHLTEVAGGYRFQTDPACGPWIRHLLDAGKPTRLSRPALETLAIIAYRQPVARAEIEGIRGVTVDHILHLLMELQLVRIVGRSELPGRPLLYGTTKMFLEHFGLNDIKNLPGIEELARRSESRAQAQAQAAAAAPPSAETDAGGQAEQGGESAAAVDRETVPGGEP